MQLASQTLWWITHKYTQLYTQIAVGSTECLQSFKKENSWAMHAWTFSSVIWCGLWIFNKSSKWFWCYSNKVHTFEEHRHQEGRSWVGGRVWCELQGQKCWVHIVACINLTNAEKLSIEGGWQTTSGLYKTLNSWELNQMLFLIDLLYCTNIATLLLTVMILITLLSMTVAGCIA